MLLELRSRLSIFAVQPLEVLEENLLSCSIQGNNFGTEGAPLSLYKSCATSTLNDQTWNM